MLLHTIPVNPVADKTLPCSLTKMSQMYQFGFYCPPHPPSAHPTAVLTSSLPPPKTGIFCLIAGAWKSSPNVRFPRAGQLQSDHGDHKRPAHPQVIQVTEFWCSFPSTLRHCENLN